MKSIKALLWNPEARSFGYGNLLVGLVFLFLCGLKLIWNFNTSVDVTFDDEVRYMRYGLDLFGHIRNDWGPTYNLWYKFLSIFESRPIELYLLNYKIVLLLVPLCLFTFLYAYGISFFTSLWLSFCLLISNTNIVTYPRISDVVASFFLLVLIINYFIIKSKAKQYLLICFVLFVGAFARPELMLSFLLFAIYTVYYLGRNARLKEVLLSSLLLLAIMGLIYGVFKLPANTYMGKDRLYGVFCQHYTIKYIYNHKADYALFINWMAFCEKQFPGCTTFADIVRHYPLVVLKGGLENIKFFLLVITSAVSDVLYPRCFFHKKMLELLSFFPVFVLLGFGIFSQQNRTAILLRLKTYRELLLILGVFALPGFVSSLLFFPRPHYLLFLLIPIVMVLAIFIDEIVAATKLKTGFITLLFVLLLICSPNIREYSTPHIISGPCPNQSYKHLIHRLNKASDRPHVIFSNILNLSMMVDKNFSDFSAEEHYNNTKTFLTQLRERNVDYILVTDFLLQDLRLKKDPSWLYFISHSEVYGFKKIYPFKDCSTYLLYKD